VSRLVFLLPVVLASSVSLAQTNYLFQQPALSSTQMVFSYAGDLWSVPRAGGEAKRLTASPGDEVGSGRLEQERHHAPRAAGVAGVFRVLAGDEVLFGEHPNHEPGRGGERDHRVRHR